MSRIIAKAGGLTYDLPQDSLARQMAVAPIKGGTSTASGAGRGDNLDPLSKLMEDELYQQEGRTQEFYNKVGALQTFAKQASSAGIDVTTPDYTNPQSIKYHTIYQKALADIQNTRNSLLRDKSFEDKSIASADIVRRFDEAGNPYFANIGQTSLAKQVQQQATQVQSEEELAIFNQNKEAYLQDIQAQLANARDPREREELASQYKEIAAVTPGIGISPFQRESLDQSESQFVRNQNRMAREAALKSQQDAKSSGSTKAPNRVMNILDILANKDTGQLATMSGIPSSQFVNRPSGTYLEMYDASGDPIGPIKIDTKDFQSFKRSVAAVNAALNRSPGSEGGGDVSNEDIISVFDNLSEEDQKNLFEQVKGTIDAREDMTEPIKSFLTSQVKEGISTDELNGLADILSNIEAPIAPESFTKKAGKGTFSVQEIKPNTGFFGGKYIEMTLFDKTANKEKTIELDLSDKEDRKLLEDFIGENVDYLSMDYLESLMVD